MVAHTPLVPALERQKLKANLVYRENSKAQRNPVSKKQKLKNLPLAPVNTASFLHITLHSAPLTWVGSSKYFSISTALHI